MARANSFCQTRKKGIIKLEINPIFHEWKINDQKSIKEILEEQNGSESNS